MSNSRFKVGQRYPFIGHIYKSKKTGNLFPAYALRDYNDDMILAETKMVLLECVSEHDVPVAYSDTERSKGYIFKNDDGVEFSNQYPTAEYGQMSTTSDYVARALIEDENGDKELITLITMESAIGDIYSVKRQFPDKVSKLWEEMLENMLTFLGENGYKVIFEPFSERMADHQFPRVTKVNSPLGLNSAMHSESSVNTQVITKVIWIVASETKSTSNSTWYHTESAAKEIFKSFSANESEKGSEQTKHYLFPYELCPETEFENINSEAYEFYESLVKNASFEEHDLVRMLAIKETDTLNKTTSKEALISKLTKIWYLIDSEDENKNPCVERRNALPLIKAALENNPSITADELWDLIADSSLDCELEETHYGDTLKEAYRSAEAYSSKLGEVVADAFISCDNRELEEDVFHNLSDKLCVALGVDTSDDVINPEYWCVAFQDELSPLDAIDQAH